MAVEWLQVVATITITTSNLNFMKQGELTGYQDRVIKAINLLFEEYGKLVIPDDAEFNSPVGGYVVCNFILKPKYKGDTAYFVSIFEKLKFEGCHCFPTNSGIVFEIFYKKNL